MVLSLRTENLRTAVFELQLCIQGTSTRELHRALPQCNNLTSGVEHVLTYCRDLNKQATGTAPSSVLRAMTPIMRCLGILDEQARGAWSSLFAVASDKFKASDSGAYIVPYAKFGKPSSHARNRVLSEKLWDWTAQELGKKGLLE